MHPYTRMMQDVRSVAEAKARAVEVALAQQEAHDLLVGALCLALVIYGVGVILYAVLKFKSKEKQ